jgi:hypothetical protein
MKYKCVLCLDLGPIPKIAHCIYENDSKSEKFQTFESQSIFWIMDIQPALLITVIPTLIDYDVTLFKIEV